VFTKLLGPILGGLTLGLLVQSAFAAGISITINQTDVSQFPRVRVSVSVADGNGVPITGLDAQAFELKEDDQPVALTRVDSVVESQEPVATALIMDVSGSMADGGKIDSARNAATAFIDTLGVRDSAALISFANDVRVVQGYTQDRAALKNAIAGLEPGGETALYDAISQTAQLQGALPQRRKVLLLLTDGADTRSKQALDATIAETQRSGAIVFAIGLGGDVNHDVLDQLAGSAGQAIYVPEADQLREAFLTIGDRLRRQYILEYQSKARSDDKPHALAINAAYRGQATSTRGSFNPPRVPLALDVKGVTNAGRVTGVQKIDVTVTAGDAKQVELLVDDQSRGVATTAPFTFQWDSQKETPGLHKVVVRATDAGGTTTDRELVLDVFSSAQATAAPPPLTAVSQVLVVTPTAVPVASPPSTVGQDQVGYIVAGLALLIIALGVGVVFMIAKSGSSRPAPVVVAPPPVPTDKTEFIGRDAAAAAIGAIGDQTAFSPRAAPPKPPRARLMVGPGREITLEPTIETSIGRDAANTIALPPTDQQASRRHARIVSEGDAFYIEDLNSMNGTKVNGEAVKRRKLASQDQISVGETVLTFVVEPTRSN
jgi:Ca-activated chloride channel family protein